MPRFSYNFHSVTTRVLEVAAAKTGLIVDIKPYNRRPSKPVVVMDS